MTNTYDAIGRITQRRLGLNSNYDTALTYKPGVNGSQTALLATYQNGGDTPYSYEYDANGNITEITQGNVSVTYSYNAANELIRENNGFTNQTVTYAYDNWGNITEKNVYAYTTAADPGTPTQTIPYAYTNSSWGDQLTSYNNQSILYDAMGNPTSYLGQTLTWRGKQLTAAGTTTYEYDENGLRLNKTVNNVSTDYYYNGSVLMSLVTGNDTLLFSYDATGQVVAVNHNGTYYYYLRNGQGDIVKLIDNSGATVVEYSYDTWGKQISCTGSLASTLGTLNPFRYRGYVYDEETGFYYLQSRYYDPTTCRFISADVLLSTGQGVLGHNCYAYCLNNPVNMVDDGGSVAGPCMMVKDDDEGGGCDSNSGTLFEKHIKEKRIGYILSKSKGRGKDSGLQNLSDDELRNLTKNTPRGKERNRLIREEKNRKLRNQRKRKNNKDAINPETPQIEVVPAESSVYSFESSKFEINMGDDLARTDNALLASLLLLFIIMDDSTGVGIFDDFAIPGILASYAYSYSYFE